MGLEGFIRREIPPGMGGDEGRGLSWFFGGVLFWERKREGRREGENIGVALFLNR